MELLDIKNENQIKELAQLANDIWHEYWPVILTDKQINYMVEKFQSFNAIKKQIETEKYIYNIIKIDNKPIGYFGICPKEKYLFLSKLYLKKEYRSHGYGKKAFEEIKIIAQKNKITSIQLTVNKYNTNTIQAYKKWGFEEIDSVVTDIGQGFVMDDYIMEFKL